MSEFDFMSALDLRRLVAARQVSPVELTERALSRAEATQSSLNVFFVLIPEAARAAARQAEEAVMRGGGARPAARPAALGEGPDRRRGAALRLGIAGDGRQRGRRRRTLGGAA